MRKHLAIAGTLLVIALLFAVPSKADSVMFSMPTPGVGITFSLPDTITSSSTSGFVFVNNVAGTLLGSNPVTFATIGLANSVMGSTNFWSFGSIGPELMLAAPGLITFNSNGTVTFNAGTWTLTSSGFVGDVTLTTTVTGGSVSTPEPASLALLGIGSLALAGLRRRKSA